MEMTDERLANILERLSAELGSDRETLLGTRLADLGIDSMDMITLVFDLEEALGVEIDVDALDTRQTVAELVSASAPEIP